MKRFHLFAIAVVGLMVMGSADMTAKGSSAAELTTTLQAVPVCGMPSAASAPTLSQLFGEPEFLRPYGVPNVRCALDPWCFRDCEDVVCISLLIPELPGGGPAYYACVIACIYPGCCL